jgi:hypothetical protein
MEPAAKADGALAQLAAGRGQHGRQHRLRRAFAQINRFFAELCTAIAIGKKDHFDEAAHEGPPYVEGRLIRLPGTLTAAMSASPTDSAIGLES